MVEKIAEVAKFSENRKIENFEIRKFEKFQLKSFEIFSIFKIFDFRFFENFSTSAIFSTKNFASFPLIFLKSGLILSGKDEKLNEKSRERNVAE